MVSRKGRKTTVNIMPDDYEWLKHHPQYSISGLLAWAIRYHKLMEEKMPRQPPF